MEQLAEIAKNHPILVWDFDHTIVSLDVDWAGLKEELATLASQGDDEPYFKLFKAAVAIDRKAAFDLQAKYEKGVSYSVHKPVLDFLKDKAGEHTYMVFTDNMRSTVETILNELNIQKYFDVIIAKDEVDAWKPSGAGLSIGMSRLHDQNKKNYLLIGDSWKDKAAAEEVGVEFFDITQVNG